MSRHILRTLKTRKAILVRNSLQLSGEKEALSTQEHGLMKWYSCGPTVYDDAHLGHARAYVSFDILRRLISNYTATSIDYSLGVTDIDDKIINRAREKNTSSKALAQHFEARFYEDMSKLNVLSPTRVLRVTEHVNDICNLVQDLETSGSAYASSTGNVFFSVKSRGERYGLLDKSRGLNNPSTDAYTDDDDDSTDPKHMAEKRDRRDFALWKRTTENDSGSAQWESPWGMGRPGWHVECSAMVLRALGNQLDLHTGGIDLRFPHHTNELAAAEASLNLAGNSRWAHTWLHAGHLHLHGRKMSKSLKNFVKVREYFQEGGCADAFRIFCMSHRYSNSVEYTDNHSEEAQAYLKRVRVFLGRDSMSLMARSNVNMKPDCEISIHIFQKIKDMEALIENGVADNFNTAVILQAVGSMISTGNKALKGDVLVSGAAGLAYEEARRVVLRVLRTIGVSEEGLGDRHSRIHEENDYASNATELLVRFREQVRGAGRRKDIDEIFKVCDKLREEMNSRLKIQITDGKNGTTCWSRE